MFMKRTLVRVKRNHTLANVLACRLFFAIRCNEAASTKLVVICFLAVAAHAGRLLKAPGMLGLCRE